MTTRWLPALVAFLVALVWRYVIVALWPTPYAFDGYQRWAGRDHLLVQDWLPATQVVIWAVARLGGGITDGRAAMALIGALAALVGTLLVQRIATLVVGERGQIVAGWVWVVASLFGPWGSWGTVFYQESTFLLVLFTGLWLALRGNLLAADLAMGALGLVRYEGWPCIALYLGWRRDPRAAVASWGMLLWIGLRLAGVRGYHASPVNFADWEGLGERFTFDGYLHDFASLANRVLLSGSLTWMILGGVGLWALRAQGVARLVALVFASQVAATLAWLAGLEVSTSRMLVIPTAVVGVLGAVGAAWAEERVPWKWVAPVGMMVMFAISVNDGARRARVETIRVRQEVAAVGLMRSCPGCTWWVIPRKGLGTRERHDGCEVIQGITDMRQGVDFQCAPWVDPADALTLYARCAGTVRWDDALDHYVLDRHLPGSTLPSNSDAAERRRPRFRVVVEDEEE